MKKGLLVLLAAAVMALALCSTSVTASAMGMRGGVVIVGPGIYGGWYAPFWGPYWGPAYMGPYYVYPNSGVVKLDTEVKDAQVFINGAYAGTTGSNKTMRLRAGSYDLEIREGGKTPFAERVYVEAGRTLHLHPEL